VQLFPELNLKKKSFLYHTDGDWKGPVKRRRFFDALAHAKSFNPLDVTKWYLVSRKDVLSAGGRAILSYYNGSHIQALISLYPEINLKKELFFFHTDKWKGSKKRRKFFDDFANFHRFDPLDAERWRSFSKKEIVNAGGNGVLKYYQGSISKALLTLYPQMKFEKNNESFTTSDIRWNSPAKRRAFFDNFAKSKRFNPLHEVNWYSITRKDILQKGGGSVLSHYKGSYIRALVELYPELNLKKDLFPNYTDCNWKTSKKRREFFDHLAQHKDFNPLHPEKWYTVNSKDVVNMGGSGILKYYNGSHIKALMQLYPEINLVKEKFTTHRHCVSPVTI